jgi:splicing factor, arginine/serine-rich 12
VTTSTRFLPFARSFQLGTMQGMPPPGMGFGGQPPIVPDPNVRTFGCYVGNIDTSVTLEMLKEFFSQCGRVVNATLNGPETGAYRFGFVDYATEPERDNALRLHNTMLASRPLRVGHSKGTTSGTNRHIGGFGPGAPGAPFQGSHQMHFQGPGAAALGGAPRFRTTINEPPSEEMLRLRELQRTQFQAVLQTQAAAYHKKKSEKVLKKARRGRSHSASSGGSERRDKKEKRDKKSKKDKKDKSSRKRSESQDSMASRGSRKRDAQI